MSRNPHLSSGVFSQTWWPGNAGRPYDDCWCLADMMAVHAVAPWVHLPTVGEYRKAAGAPETPGIDPGSIDMSVKAIRKLWPKIGALIKVIKGGTWADFETAMTKDRVASLSVRSGSLPTGLRYGFNGNHRVTAFLGDAGLQLANPLAPPHSPYRDISEAALRKAVADHSLQGVYAIVMPSVAAAFKTHPLA